MARSNPLSRFLRAGLPATAPPEEAEQIVIRNGALGIAALAAVVSGTILLLTGSWLHGVISMGSGIGCSTGLLLCIRGHHQSGILVALGVTNVMITMGVTAEGAENLSILHIATVCLPFSLFHARERSAMLAGVGMGIAGMVVSAVPLVPSPWMPGTSEEVSNVRAVASIAMTLIVAVQLWFFVVNRDRNLARLREAVTEANDASRAKSAFLANMSHEVRTPINGVLGMLGILEGTKLDSLQREYVQTARASGVALLDVINDILDLSKVEAGQLRLEPVSFDLRATLEDVLDQFALQTATKELELVLRYVPGTPQHVEADAGRIRQVVTNLTGNAIKFTRHGHVLVTVACDEQAQGRAVLRVSVEDTGPGIPDDRREEVFEKFRQLDGSATREHPGAGLGLSITRELVELMGGEIGLRSREGQGTTFWFTLPVQLDEAGPPSQAAAEALVSARVLIVDDEPVNRRVLREQLASWGIDEQACASGAEALVRLREAEAEGTPFDLVVLDQQMPTMDGLELARQIKADEALSDIALVLLTSVTHATEVDEIKAVGIVGYLVKPVHHSELMDVLAAALRVRAGGTDESLVTRQLLPERTTDTPGAEPYAGMRVLVAEDNAINQKVAVKLLERLGCVVDVAGNGEEALRMVDGGRYDVVFMDVQMPVMDGLDATRSLRERGWTVPIVAMTAHAMQGDRERCLAAGMNGYVSKPVQRESLGRELGRVIRPDDRGSEAGAAEREA